MYLRPDAEKRETSIISRDEIAVSSSNNVLINDHAMGGLKTSYHTFSSLLFLSLSLSFVRSFTRHVHLPSYIIIPHQSTRSAGNVTVISLPVVKK